MNREYIARAIEAAADGLVGPRGCEVNAAHHWACFDHYVAGMRQAARMVREFATPTRHTSVSADGNSSVARVVRDGLPDSWEWWLDRPEGGEPMEGTAMNEKEARDRIAALIGGNGGDR